MTAAIRDFKDGVSFTGYAGSSTIGPFSLLGGLYALAISDTGTPDATLSALMPDGSTYVPVAAAVVVNGAADLFTAAGEILKSRPAPAPSASASFRRARSKGSLIRVPYSRY